MFRSPYTLRSLFMHGPPRQSPRVVFDVRLILLIWLPAASIHLLIEHEQMLGPLALGSETFRR